MMFPEQRSVASRPALFDRGFISRQFTGIQAALSCHKDELSGDLFPQTAMAIFPAFSYVFAITGLAIWNALFIIMNRPVHIKPDSQAYLDNHAFR